MKTITIIVIFASSLIYSQTISDTTQNKQRNQEQEKIQNQNINKIENQIGPKSNPQAHSSNGKKRIDVFIDKDGDGISDTRQGGMSFNKIRKRMGSGKKGPHSGGSGGGNGSGYNGGH